MGRPYKISLYLAVAITALLFFLDYTVWDKDRPFEYKYYHYLFEIIMWGSMYVLIFWSVISLISFFGMKWNRLVDRLIK
jgi:hypothetical protein